MTSDHNSRFWRDFIDHAATTGDGAEDLVREFCDCVEAGFVPDWHIMECLAKRFRHLLESGDAARLRSLLTTAPQPVGKTPLRRQHELHERDLEYARLVATKMKQGARKDDAIDAVAAELKASSRTAVKKAYEDHGKLVREIYHL